MEKIFEKCTGFQRDKGNSEKNWLKHKVLKFECEQVFFNKPMIVSDAKKISDKEKRWYILGITDLGRLLFVVFTIRNNLVRVISARDMNKKEREKYNERIKKDT